MYVCRLILIIWSCLFLEYLCRGKLRIGKISLALSHCLSSIQQLVSLKRTMPVMLLQLSWPVSRQKLRCLNSVFLLCGRACVYCVLISPRLNYCFRKGIFLFYIYFVDSYHECFLSRFFEMVGGMSKMPRSWFLVTSSVSNLEILFQQMHGF
jgi:hypothetical protein